MLGERMKQARIALGYSAEQVAEFLGVSPATVYRYENGDISKFPGRLIKPLADFLCVSPAYLMGWDDESDMQWHEIEPKTEKVRVLMQNISQLDSDDIDQLTNVFWAMFAKKLKKGNNNT